MLDTPALEIDCLSYTYTEDWTRKKREAIRALSLTVKAGEAFGFLGHNGAGKTTTIKAILNLISPQQGTIKIFGENWKSLRSRRAVGYLPEQPYFYDYLTVQETLELYACLAEVPSEGRARTVAATLEKVGLGDRKKVRLRTLSKGLTQRVALAQAIIAKPKLLILDEPFSGLDPLGRREFRNIFSELKAEGATIFMSSHILSDVEFLCDRASIMVKGVVREIFDLREKPAALSGEEFELTVQSSEDASVLALGDGASSAASHERSGTLQRLRFTDRSRAEQALKAALEKGFTIESFERRQISLEDLFMRIVSDSGDSPTPHSKLDSSGRAPKNPSRTQL
jgi:ABC-2 type transport system ATP-binding protein